MRVLHVVHGFAEESPAGTELHVRELARRQASAAGGGHAAAIFARTHSGEAADLSVAELPSDGTVRRFGFLNRGRAGTSFLGRDDLPPAARAFEQVVDIVRPDVVHVHHLAGLSARILPLAKRAGARVVLTLHDHALACPRGRRVRSDLAPCPTLDRNRCAACVRPAWIEAVRAPTLRSLIGVFRPGEGRRLFAVRDLVLRDALSSVDCFLAPSRSAADLFREFFDPGPALSVLPHGSIEVVRTAPPEFPQGRPAVLGFFGAPHPTKGITVLAEAVRRLGSAVRLVLHGPANATEVGELERRFAIRCELAGPYAPERLSDRMDAVDVVVIPSLFPETFSLTLREAWAHRKPAVVSRVGALAEAAGNDERALTAIPGDAESLFEAVLRATTDQSLFLRLTGPFSEEPRSAALDRTTAQYV